MDKQIVIKDSFKFKALYIITTFFGVIVVSFPDYFPWQLPYYGVIAFSTFFWIIESSSIYKSNNFQTGKLSIIFNFSVLIYLAVIIWTFLLIFMRMDSAKQKKNIWLGITDEQVIKLEKTASSRKGPPYNIDGLATKWVLERLKQEEMKEKEVS